MKRKLNIWKKELKKLEEVELPSAMQKIGQSATSADFHESAEYAQVQQEVFLIQTRIEAVKNMVERFGKGIN